VRSAGVDLAGVDLAGVDLAGVDLAGVDLAGALGACTAPVSGIGGFRPVPDPAACRRSMAADAVRRTGGGA
jgi:Pentapeptide repeats (8 copies)